MNSSRLGLFALLFSVGLAAGSAQGGEGPASDEVAPALKPLVDLRLRSENVTQTGVPNDAEAITLRGRLGFETRAIRSTAFLAEAEVVWPLATDYNSTLNGKTEYPVVSDPEAEEINRLQLTNTAIEDTRIVIGRQRITLEDQRFIGNVGWRQNEQTFDALRIVNTSVNNLTLDVTYLNQVNRITGPESAMGRYHGDSFLASAAVRLPVGVFTAFTTLLEFEEAPADSSSTVGARYVFSRYAGPVKLGGALAYAMQEDRAENPLDYEAEYGALALSGSLREWSLEAGIEQLTGDGTKGFATPLATLHKFQGWADKFLTTPPDGVDDRYLTAGYINSKLASLSRLSLMASYHAFTAERGAADFGSEFDLQLRAEWKRLRAGLKFADYAADGFATDTTKYWIEAEYTW